MKRIPFIILSLLISLPAIGQQKFARQEVLEDLALLRSTLEKAHYNLYAYTTEEAFNENFEKVKASVREDSISLLGSINYFQTVVSAANNGHTEIPFPGSVYGGYVYGGGTLFPLEIAFEEGKALVRKNFSGNDSIELGSEILSINGQPIARVLEKIYPLISAEREYFELAKIELFSFPRLFWQAYGEIKSFGIEIKNRGKTERYNIASVDAIEGFEMKRNEVFHLTRELKFLDEAAWLQPGNFSGEEEKYKRFIDSAFTEINKRNPENLIIDLRNNLGGYDAYSNFLVSYIADQPFQWCSDFTLKTSAILKTHVRETYDTTQIYWQNVLTHPDGSIYPHEFEDYQPQPAEKRFSGKVYVLVNRQSHSQSAVTAAQFQDLGLATIVGEETGDFPSLFASQYGFSLPHTGVEVKLAKGFIVRINGSKKPQGVIPDIYIRDHLLDENDEILEGLLEVIKDQK